MRIGYARERQAGVTRIVEATRQLLKSEGYVGDHRSHRPAGRVYAIFKSKTGILTAFLDQYTFRAEYEELVQQASTESDP